MDDLRGLIELVPAGATRYFNCPYCGGRNKTLGITKEDGRVKWGCFRNSCTVRGAKDDNVSLEEVKLRLINKSPTPWAVPDYFINGISNEKGVSMLQKYHCVDAYRNRWFKCAYDPKEDRLVIYITDESGKILGAVGRLLTPAKGKPKVLNYSAPAPFMTLNDSRHLIVVEDCFSAISATRFGYKGCALLGTILKREYIQYLVGYSSVTIALDADAKSKAIKIHQELREYIPYVNYIFLKKDIKDIDTEVLEDYVDSISNKNLSNIVRHGVE